MKLIKADFSIISLDLQKMSPVEIQENAEILIIAGSETTATTLCGATYLLTTNPRCLHKMQQEIRSSFQSEDEINIVNTAKLKYTQAVLDETMRRYPPVAACTPRQTPPEGNTILGKYVPGNVYLFFKFFCFISSVQSRLEYFVSLIAVLLPLDRPWRVALADVPQRDQLQAPFRLLP